jgi:hypothetical protein
MWADSLRSDFSPQVCAPYLKVNVRFRVNDSNKTKCRLRLVIAHCNHYNLDAPTAASHTAKFKLNLKTSSVLSEAELRQIKYGVKTQ